MLSWLISILIFEFAPLSHAGCGEYCSNGLVKSYHGDIRQSANLHTWLKSVAFKDELIVLHFTGSHVDMALQFHHELLTHGFAHHSFLGLLPSDCERLTGHRPLLSCIFDSTPIPDWIVSGEPLLWHYRMKLAARTIRLGYNLMMMDLDSIFFRSDIYSYLKSPPLSSINFICPPEAGAPSYNCNVGFMYFQNVKSNGPVSWVFKEVVWNLLRRADDHYQFLATWTGKTSNQQTFDQSWVFDAMKSAAAGLRVSEILTHQKGEVSYIGYKGQKMTPHEVREKTSQLANPYKKMVCYHPMPEALAQSIGLSDIPHDHKKICYGNLTVPNLAYGFPEELGGRGWPDGPLGNFSSDFEHMLKEDCPQCPDWPENRPTIPTDRFQDLLSKPEMNITDIQLFLDDSIATETFAMSPPWLIYSLLNVRTGTLTGPNNKHHQGYPFVGHIHRWGDMGFPFYYKLEARKVYGRYNYSLGYELLRKQGEPDIKIYGFGKTDRSKKANVSTVISLSPNIDLRRTRTWGEFASIVYGLLQVARLSGRIAVLPDLPCETSWLYSEEELNDSNLNSTLCLAPLMANGLSWALQYPVDPSTGELIGGWRKRRRRGMTEALNITRDSWWATHQFMALIPQAIGEACIHLGTMVRPEFTNWLRHEGKEGHPHPTESNTVFRLQDPSDQDLQLVPKVYRSEGAGMVYRPVRNKGWSWFDVQAQLSSADVAAEMQRVRSEPVVYMEHPVLIKQVEPSSSQSTSDKSLWAMHEELMTEVRESRVCYLLIDHEEWLRSRKMILPNTDRGVPCIIEKDNSKMIKSAHVR